MKSSRFGLRRARNNGSMNFSRAIQDGVAASDKRAEMDGCVKLEHMMQLS